MLKTSQWCKAAALAAVLAVSPLSMAAGINTVEEEPTALAMMGDLVIVRPVMLATTVVGSAVWLVSLPFSAAAGNAMQAADTLVVGPAETTFFRCLGCTRPGYRVTSE
ncbi:hypothetical protein [Pseudomaricurvus hydrocarbonicus]|uniref:hypothetical protein n=1 Tax=Pseudomaricurvus hydrocarbonicus TaxID=1470433 RepID=UPI001FB60C32